VTGQRALERLFADCARDAACAAAFPNLRADLEALLASGEAGSLKGTAAGPRTGAMSEIAIDRDGVVGLVRGALYVGMTRALAPYAIVAAARGDPKPLVALGAATAEWSADTMSLGAMLGIICGEDQALARKSAPARLSFGFMRDSYFRYFAAACSVWPHRELPAAMFKPLSSSVPALAISGEADPVTPPASGEATLKQFSRRVHVVIPNGFHTNSSNPCVARIIAQFLNDPLAGGRDHSCANRVRAPRFITSPNA
jgi:pimeloyl-ACP methyl ester carboxylesterase